MKIEMFVNLVVCVLVCILITDNFDRVKANADSYQCVRLQDCPHLFALSKDPSQADVVLEKICGNDGHFAKVWCSKHQTCHTPDGLPGVCKPLANCKPVHKITSNPRLVEIVTKGYLRALVCPNAHSSSISPTHLPVCCPSDEDEFERRLFPKSVLPDPDKTECGFNAIDKITNGKVADLADYPWTALLHFNSTTTNDVVKCAGSLISKQYVITAAHCVQDSVVQKNGNLNRVTLGEYNIKNKTDCIGNTCANAVVVAPVESVILHPDWYTNRQQVINNDIALIRLTQPVQFSPYVYPVCLPQANSNIPDNVELEITGWGYTEEGETSDVKLKAIVHSYNKNKCRQYYRSHLDLHIGDGEFCAIGAEGMDSCFGDSGGPIMERRRNAKRIQITYLAGLVSFGAKNCGQDDAPAVYTQTSKYTNWIKKNIRP